MTRPSDAEVTAEITKLKALEPRVHPFSSFGDDNRAAIAAAIDVLSDRLTLDQVDGRYGEDAFLDPDEFDPYVLDAAISTCDWLHGVLASDELPPAMNWEGLAR